MPQSMLTPDYHGTARIYTAPNIEPSSISEGIISIITYSDAESSSCFCWLEKSSIVSPSFRVTMAFFQVQVWPS